MMQEALAAMLGDKISTIPWYAYTALTVAPFFVGCLLAIALSIYRLRINKKSGGEPYSVKSNYHFSFLVGFACGCFTQYSLQEVGEHLLSIPPLTLKATIVTGIFVSIFNQMILDLLRGFSLRKEWTGLYSFLTVQHVKKKETKIDVSFDDDGGVTVNEDDEYGDNIDTDTTIIYQKPKK